MNHDESPTPAELLIIAFLAFIVGLGICLWAFDRLFNP